MWYQSLNESLQIGLWRCVGFLIQEYQKMEFQMVEFLVMVSWSSDLLVVVFLVEEFLVEVIVDVEFLVEEFLFVESVVAEFLVVVESLDFVVRERKNLDQINQYQTELWQVLVGHVQDLDFERWSEVHSENDLEFHMDQSLC